MHLFDLRITTTPLSTVRIGKQVLPSTQVCQALHSLTPEHLQAVYRITKYSNNVRKPKGYLLALLYNAAQAAPESNLYAQFFAMPPEEHKPRLTSNSTRNTIFSIT